LLAYWAARQFFPILFSFIFTWLFAFSFWAFSLMRFCTPEDLIPFFQLMAFGLLGKFLHSQGKFPRFFWLLCLSVCSVVGFYSYINWAPVWFFTTMILGGHALRHGTNGKVFFILSQFLVVVLILPLVMARLAPGGMSYISSVWEGHWPFHSVASYLAGLFWDSKVSYPFAPNWGGMLDPITGSLVLLGLIYTIKRLDLLRLVLLGLGLFVSILPGVVTNYLELHRITPSLPFWIFLAVFGIQSLISKTTRQKTRVLLTAMCASVLCLNFYNFTTPYCDITKVPSVRQWRNVSYFNAYQILNSRSRPNKPMYLFSEFSLDYDNKTLNTTCYPFDVLQNQKLDQGKANLVAFLVKMDYALYFLSAFPGIDFTILPTDKAEEDSLQTGLFLVPVLNMDRSTLQAWRQADRVCRNINRLIKNKNPVEPWSAFVDILLRNKDAFKTDAFLRTVFWEKIAFFHYLNADFRKASEAYELAIRQGLEVAHLYQNDGLCLKLIGENQKAETAFKKAREISSR
jgi:hypothetical protein